ncbi:MAG: hypothetical protein ACRDUX_23640 [Mycobacterium sp.]
MWWLRTTTYVMGFCVLVGLVGCGSAGFSGDGSTDELTFTFLGFTGEGIEQQDIVGNTSADVDVCATICDFGEDGIFGDETFESFTQTRAIAQFVNNGTADIRLQRYTVSVPGSGVPPLSVDINIIMPGGRCSNQPNQQCGLDTDCLFGNDCVHDQVDVEVLLFTFAFKELIKGEGKTCPGVDPLTGLPTQGNVVPQTYQTNVTFEASDSTGQGFTVKAGLVAGFFDANNCDDTQ